MPSLQAPLQLHPHAAVAEQPQPIVGQRRAAEVVAQLFPDAPGRGPHPHVGVQVEAPKVRVARRSADGRATGGRESGGRSC